jgi:hypothetical protein
VKIDVDRRPLAAIPPGSEARRAREIEVLVLPRRESDSLQVARSGWPHDPAKSGSGVAP